MRKHVMRGLAVVMAVLLAAQVAIPVSAKQVGLKCNNIKSEEDYNASVDWNVKVLNVDKDGAGWKSSFTLKKDSVVIIDAKASEKLPGDFLIYSNKARTQEVLKKSERKALFNGKTGDQEILTLKAGTYYTTVSLEKGGLLPQFSKDKKVSVRLAISVMPIENAIKYTYKVDGNTVRLSVKSPMSSFVQNWCIAYTGDAQSLVTSKNSVRIDKEIGLDKRRLSQADGRLLIKGIAAGERYSVAEQGLVRILNFDLEGPDVRGVENGGCYHDRTGEITASDASGIGAYRLDGEKVTRGIKVTEKGFHNLIVTDTRGNETTIRFLII